MTPRERIYDKRKVIISQSDYEHEAKKVKSTDVIRVCANIGFSEDILGIKYEELRRDQCSWGFDTEDRGRQTYFITYFVVGFYREETNEEYSARIREIERSKKEQEKKDRDLYIQLKSRFETEDGQDKDLLEYKNMWITFQSQIEQLQESKSGDDVQLSLNQLTQWFKEQNDKLRQAHKNGE